MSGDYISDGPLKEPVPIVGLGCITAAGHNRKTAVESMFSGRRQPLPVPSLSGLHSTDYPVFSIPEKWIEEKLDGATRLDRCSELAWIATREALTEACLNDSDLPGRRVGVCLGTVAGGALDDFSFQQDYRSGNFPAVSPVMDFINSNCAERIREMLSVRGPVLTATTACTSGSQAIIQAADWIRRGICDIVVAGGTEKISRLTYSGFISLRITDNMPCRPFDKNRSGLNLGEGAGIVILESLASLKRRGAEVLAWYAGGGNACDAWHLSRPSADGEGLQIALREALQETGLGEADIGFVNAHGTATPDNDLVEGKVLNRTFARVPFYSTKSYTGHTLGAAGAIEAVFVIDGLLRQQIPGTAGFSEKDPDIGFEPTRQPLSLPRAAAAVSTSVAYGGNNTALLFTKYCIKKSKASTAPFQYVGSIKGYWRHSSSPAAAKPFTREENGVVIRGIGTVGGFGCGRRDVLRAFDNQPGPNDKVEVDIGCGKQKVPAFIVDSSPLKDIFPSSKLRRVDRFSRITTLAAYSALEDGGMLGFDPADLGIIMATGYGVNHTTFRFIDDCIDYGDNAASPLLFSGAGHSGVLSNTTILLGVKGPLLTVCQPRLAFSTALQTAVFWLHERRVGAVLVGGAEEYVPLIGYVRQSLFEKSGRTSLSIGEGASFLLLTLENSGNDGVPLSGVETAAALESLDFSRSETILGGGACRSQRRDLKSCCKGNGQNRFLTGDNIYGVMPVGMAFDLALAAALVSGVKTEGNQQAGSRRLLDPPLPVACLETDGKGRYGTAIVG